MAQIGQRQIDVKIISVILIKQQYLINFSGKWFQD